jgi:hypothetical protein
LAINIFPSMFFLSKDIPLLLHALKIERDISATKNKLNWTMD